MSPTTPPSTVIRPRRTWLPPTVRELWEYRDLLMRFCARDITLRYRQTALGVIWVILVPLLGAGILSFIFGGIANLEAPTDAPYYLFAFAGMVVFTAFSQVVNRSGTVMVSNSGLVSKVYFPRVLLPLSVVMSSLVDVAAALSLLAVLMIANGIVPGFALVTLPLWLIGAAMLALGIGLIAGALMVLYRDIVYIVPVIVQLTLFASPVAYSVSEVPDETRWVYDLNPLVGLLEGLRWSVLDTPEPSWSLTVYAASTSAAVLVLGMVVFSRMEQRFADVI